MKGKEGNLPFSFLRPERPPLFHSLTKKEWGRSNSYKEKWGESMGKKVKLELKSNLAPKQQNVGDILNYKTSLRGPQREWNSTMGISYGKRTQRGKNLSCWKDWKSPKSRNRLTRDSKRWIPKLKLPKKGDNQERKRTKFPLNRDCKSPRNYKQIKRLLTEGKPYTDLNQND